ncbi:MAG: YggS family pyridoxal phosphate-dependent enzyme [Treponemataceae bacterium]|nr:YggS family pyridoxal phosphate-dependent enzyme [Treponemataceae bacterium]
MSEERKICIKDNLEHIKEKIHDAELRAGRKVGSVKLMAVSKFHPAEAVIEAYKAGQKLFGENRVQEACGKFPQLTEKYPDIELHLIGSLQRNKVRQIIPLVTCIQSVDRIELVDEIIKQCRKLKTEGVDKKLCLLFEYHTGEESKSGFLSEDELMAAVERAGSASDCGIICSGFMTMAPFTDDKDAVRASFRKLRELSERVRKQFPFLPLDELSMGMSGDYEIAVEEGSTLVRVGTAIFGERNYA